MKTIAIFLSSISEEKFIKKFQGVFSTLLTIAVEAIKADEASGKTALGALSELSEVHPKFIKPIVNDLIVLMTEIIVAKGLSEGILEIYFL